MVLRFILRYFSNNEQFINKLADSKPLRKTAQMVVYLLSKTSSYSGSHQLPSNGRDFAKQILSAAKKFSADFQKELKAAQEEVKRKQSK